MKGEGDVLVDERVFALCKFYDSDYGVEVMGLLNLA